MQWLRCTDEDNQLYVDAEEDLALLSAIVHTDADLSVENVALAKPSNARSRNKKKRKSRSTAAADEEVASATCPHLNDDNRSCIIRAGFFHFG